MFLARVIFGAGATKPVDRDRLGALAAEYLDCLVKSGQICGEYFYAWQKGRLYGYAHLARPGAGGPRHLSAWGRSRYKEVLRHFAAAPTWQLLDDSVPRRFPGWRSAPAFYLFTRFDRDVSPLCRLNDGQTLPLTDEEREEAFFWTRIYRNHDAVWIDSGALELAAYRQLADPPSELFTAGRKLAAKLESRLRKPVYYYAFRYYGRKNEGPERVCPACGQAWLVAESPAEDTPFHHFPYRCDACRLVSHPACDSGNAHQIKIGLYPG